MWLWHLRQAACSHWPAAVPMLRCGVCWQNLLHVCVMYVCVCVCVMLLLLPHRRFAALSPSRALAPHLSLVEHPTHSLLTPRPRRIGCCVSSGSGLSVSLAPLRSALATTGMKHKGRGAGLELEGRAMPDARRDGRNAGTGRDGPMTSGAAAPRPAQQQQEQAAGRGMRRCQVCECPVSSGCWADHVAGESYQPCFAAGKQSMQANTHSLEWQRGEMVPARADGLPGTTTSAGNRCRDVVTLAGGPGWCVWGVGVGREWGVGGSGGEKHLPGWK